MSRIEKLFSILEKSSSQGYIGEPISQLEHALQAAYFATRAKASNEAIVAALFHDIGHLCAHEGAHEMPGLGIVDHETLGANFLLTCGLPQRVADLVAGHVQAKRFLVFSNPDYIKRLSHASKTTLELQGGPMTAAEAEDFKKDPLFKTKLSVRHWDEMAKEPDIQVPDLKTYIPLVTSILDSN